MIIELLDKLIDRCIQLVNHKEQLNRRTFEEFVQPAYEHFELVHQRYLVTFKAYRDAIQSTGNIVSVLDRIKQDILFNEHQRTKALALVKQLDDPKLSNFVFSIYRYLTLLENVNERRAAYPNYVNFPMPLNPSFNDYTDELLQRWGHTLHEELKRLSKCKDHKWAAEIALPIIDSLVQDMQDEASLVTHHYTAIKKKAIR